MLPTVFAGLVALMAIGSWRYGIAALTAVIAGMLLLGGSAAILLPAIGGTSISPAHLALVSAILWLLLKRDQQGLIAAIAENRWLLGFAVFGVVSAIVLPKLFAGDIFVTPMRPTRMDFVREPLGPTPQNITQSVYLIGTALAAVIAAYAARYGKRPYVIMAALLAAGAANIAFGVVDLVGFQPVLDFFRNGAYAQLDQDFGASGLKRLSGVFPEPSAFAAFGFGILVVSGELWLRHIWPRVSGVLALLSIVTLIASTSTTAYGCLAIYLPVMTLRIFFLTQGARRLTKGITLATLLLTTAVLVMLVMVLQPGLAAYLQKLLNSLTVGKLDTSSGRERLSWATQGFEAFKATFGLGIGVGSFRSSSMVTAVIGSTGVIGCVLLGAYLLTLLAPWRRDAYQLDLDQARGLGEAAAAAALFSLLPAALSSPLPDPGLLFGILAGYALGARAAAKARPMTEQAPPPLSRLEMRRQQLRQRSS
jgi:hypothetical protein